MLKFKRMLILVMMISLLMSSYAMTVYAEDNTRLDGFMNIPWGANYNVVEKALLGNGFKPWSGYDAIGEHPKKPEIWEGTWAGEYVRLWLSFVDNKFYRAKIEKKLSFDAPEYQRLYPVYMANYQGLLSEKYGKPVCVKESTAYMWSFPSDKGINNTISVYTLADPLYMVFVEYENGALKKVAAEKN